MNDISDILHGLALSGNLRKLPDGEKRRLDFVSNDYLGLGARHMDFRQEFADRFGDAEFSSSASRLLSSRQRYHIMLEQQLATAYGKDALLFNSGYHANVGCVSALASLPDTLIVADKLIHASVIDGLMMSKAIFKRFPHNDMASLRNILSRHCGQYKRIIVITESIFSMDGDEAPLDQLTAIKNEYPGVMLYVDEAHGFGVRGHQGLGCAEATGTIADIDIIIGTFGKAAASAGAFAACSHEIKSFLINRARPFIFSTAIPPANAAWTILMMEKIRTMEKEREWLSTISHTFKKHLTDTGADTGLTTSQIVPLITGDSEKAMQIAASLRQAGIDALPIRRPTVPPGGERIRFSLNALLKPEDIDYIISLLQGMRCS